MISWILSETLLDREVNILDIGTGSGCIAISLAKNLPNAKVFALDVSKDALLVAKKNADNNGVLVTFLEHNILQEPNLQQKFDVIVSNPPYVRELEKKEMTANVLKHEPSLALFVSDKEPLTFYNAITNFAVKHLNENGKLYFEINQYLGFETQELLEKQDFVTIELRKDMFGNDRMLRGQLIK